MKVENRSWPFSRTIDPLLIDPFDLVQPKRDTLHFSVVSQELSSMILRWHNQMKVSPCLRASPSDKGSPSPPGRGRKHRSQSAEFLFVRKGPSGVCPVSLYDRIIVSDILKSPRRQNKGTK